MSASTLGSPVRGRQEEEQSAAQLDDVSPLLQTPSPQYAVGTVGGFGKQLAGLVLMSELSTMHTRDTPLPVREADPIARFTPMYQ